MMNFSFLIVNINFSSFFFVRNFGIIKELNNFVDQSKKGVSHTKFLISVYKIF